MDAPSAIFETPLSPTPTIGKTELFPPQNRLTLKQAVEILPPSPTVRTPSCSQRVIDILLFPFIVIYLIITGLLLILMSPWICTGRTLRHSAPEYTAKPTIPSPSPEPNRIDGYFQNEDGLAIFWSATLPTLREGERPRGVVHFFHGMGEYHLFVGYRRVREALASRGFMLVLCDLFVQISVCSHDMFHSLFFFSQRCWH